MRTFLERIADDPWIWGLRLALVIVGMFFVLVLTSVLSGCATVPETPPAALVSEPERLLTEEQDQLVYEMCKDGCAVLSAEQWYVIQKMLKQCGYIVI